MLFTNGPELFDNTYLRYLEKTFRDQLPFGEVPIKLTLRLRHGAGGPSVEEAPEDETAPAAEPPKKRRSAASATSATRGATGEKGSESGLWTDV